MMTRETSIYGMERFAKCTIESYTKSGEYEVVTDINLKEILRKIANERIRIIASNMDKIFYSDIEQIIKLEKISADIRHTVSLLINSGDIVFRPKYKKEGVRMNYILLEDEFDKNWQTLYIGPLNKDQVMDIVTTAKKMPHWTLTMIEDELSKSGTVKITDFATDLETHNVDVVLF